MAEWSDVPHRLTHLRIHRSFMNAEPRSHPRVYSPLGPYTSTSSHFSLDNRDHRNGKAGFPDLKPFAPELNSSCSSQDEIPRPSRSKFNSYLPRIAAAHSKMNNKTCQRKWTHDDLEKYFNQMRIDLTRTRDEDVDSDNVIRRPREAVHRGESPVTSSPMETDDSISGESLRTSSANTLNSGNGVPVPERNKVILEKIRLGLDSRTTIMIKNVPNKYTQVTLSLLKFG